MRPRALLLVLLVLSLVTVMTAPAAAAESKAKPPPLSSVIHDLRDLLPICESKTGKAEEPILTLSVKDGSFWHSYSSYNTSGTGYLNRIEVAHIVETLVKSLRVSYPETYAAIDVDGDDTITWTKFQAYMSKPK